MLCQVRYGGIHRSSPSPRPPCNGIPSASVWPSPRRTPGPPCPYPSFRTPLDATMKPVDATSLWSSHSDSAHRTRKNPIGGILRRDLHNMPVEVSLALPMLFSRVFLKIGRDTKMIVPSERPDSHWCQINIVSVGMRLSSGRHSATEMRGC